MSHYPATVINLFYLALVYFFLLLIGYPVAKRNLAWVGWLCLVLCVSAMWLVFRLEHPVIKMLAIIITTFTAMKMVVVAESYRNKPFKLSFFQWLAFTAGWAGMQPKAFETVFSKNLPGGGLLINQGVIRILIGLLLITLAHLTTDLAGNTQIITNGLLLVGLSLILHFGILTVSAGLWRFFGADTYLLFRQPAKSNSLAEFWGRRWNLAFIEMLSIAVLRPFKTKIGNTTAVLVSFLLSGLLHEIAITLPVNAGFGGPTIYFIIQGIAVVAEKKMEEQNIALSKNKLLAKLWLLFWLIVPIRFLFPDAFIEQIVRPLANLNPILNTAP
ncbi:MBOAT family protein [Mucilaginibacter sp. HD30]